jgi:hypothetical protein
MASPRRAAMAPLRRVRSAPRVSPSCPSPARGRGALARPPRPPPSSPRLPGHGGPLWRSARPRPRSARRPPRGAASPPRPTSSPAPSPTRGSASCPSVTRSPARRGDPRRGALALASPRPARGLLAWPARGGPARPPPTTPTPRPRQPPRRARPAPTSPRSGRGVSAPHGAARALGLGPLPWRLAPPLRGLPQPWRGLASARRARPRPPVLPGALAVARPLPLHDMAPSQRGPGPARLRLSRPRCPCVARRMRSSAPACARPVRDASVRPCARMLAWCARCFGTARRAPRHARLPLDMPVYPPSPRVSYAR